MCQFVLNYGHTRFCVAKGCCDLSIHMQQNKAGCNSMFHMLVCQFIQGSQMGTIILTVDAL